MTVGPRIPLGEFLVGGALDDAMNGFTRAVIRADRVDPLISELVRLRCAQIHDCRLCSSMRMQDALDAGLDEQMTMRIARYETGGFSPAAVAALRLTDAIIIAPTLADAALADELHRYFDDEQIAEICLDVMKWSYQKTLVALRLETPPWESAVLSYDEHGDPVIDPVPSAPPAPTPELVERLILSRRSVRSFRPDPVPRETLEAALALASAAPSNSNMQPWHVEIVSGETRDRLSAALVAAMAEGRYAPDYDDPEEMYEPHHAARREAMGERLYGSMGIARDDQAGRSEWYFDNLRFFGAPHAALLFMPPNAGPRMVNDVGIYGQTLMLALAGHGVGSCPQGILGYFADTVRETLGITTGRRLLFGLSIGYADEDAPVNRIEMPRAPLAETVRWHG